MKQHDKQPKTHHRQKPYKQSVKIRFRQLAKGAQSIYLDTYTNGKRTFEFLKLYIVPELTPEDRAANIEAAAIAIESQKQRQRELLTGETKKPLKQPERIHQTKPLKQPVKIRFKKLAKGAQSIYLDTYTNGKRTFEFLKLYIVPEHSPEDKAANAATMERAKAIQAERTLQLIEAHNPDKS